MEALIGYALFQAVLLARLIPWIRHQAFAASYWAFTFDSAADFLECSRSDEAACLVLDVQLPDISGLELQGRLADDNSPPVIFISGHSDVPSTVRAMKAGAIEFLLKPVPGEVLLTSVRAALAKDKIARRQRSELTRLRERYSRLSQREREVFPLVVSGLLNKQSASVLGIAEVTLQVHRRQIMSKMEAGSLAELVRIATRLGISPASVARPRADRPPSM
ncbi:MAG: response regulator [Gammaproteobacteria bacterium]